MAVTFDHPHIYQGTRNRPRQFHAHHTPGKCPSHLNRRSDGSQETFRRCLALGTQTTHFQIHRKDYNAHTHKPFAKPLHSKLNRAGRIGLPKEELPRPAWASPLELVGGQWDRTTFPSRLSPHLCAERPPITGWRGPGSKPALNRCSALNFHAERRSLCRLAGLSSPRISRVSIHAAAP